MLFPLNDISSTFWQNPGTALQAEIAHEQTLALRDEFCRSRFLLHPRRTKRVFLFFHGFTAVPQQFVPMGENFYQSGDNVLMPLLPGHGRAGEWNGQNPPPLPERPETYQEFGQRWLQIAQSWGDRVIVGGLSGGSTLAAWLALEHPEQIDRSLLFAPYLGNANPLVDWVVRFLDIYFRWHTPDGAISYGYEGFAMPALRVFLQMGAEILQRARQEAMSPFLIVDSESDRAVSHAKNRALYQSALAFQPHCQYHWFDRSHHIPHNMMTRAEGNPQDEWVWAIARNYVELNLTSCCSSTWTNPIAT